MRFFRNLAKYWDYAVYSAKSTLKTEVANSYLNWVWWMLEPLGMMCVYAVVFGVFFRSKEPYYEVFIFIGLTLWKFFSGMFLDSINLIRRRRSVVANVYIPKYVLLLSHMLYLGFKMLLSFGIIVIMVFVYKVPIGKNIICGIPVFCVYIVFCYGIGMFFLNLGVYVSDLFEAMKIVLRMLLYMSGVFYSIEKRVPQPFGRELSIYNPIAYFINSFRNTVLYNQQPEWKILIVWALVSLCFMVMSIWIIEKNENDYVKVI